jgi:hypothetical protein
MTSADTKHAELLAILGKLSTREKEVLLHFVQETVKLKVRQAFASKGARNGKAQR